MIDRLKALAPTALASISLLALPAAYAEDVKLPPTMVVTAYDTGTAGFNIAVGVVSTVRSIPFSSATGS